jgi:hypothetical protein
MTQTSTTPALTDTDAANLAALVNLDDRIASYRRKISANRGSQKLANERQEILGSLQAQRKGLCALLPLDVLATYLRDTHETLMDHTGAGKMLIVGRRGDAIREYRSALIGRAQLTSMATDPDVLSIALGGLTVAAVNQRHAEIDAEIAAEDAALVAASQANTAVTDALATAKATQTKTEFPADIQVLRTDHPDLPFRLVATDDNPSHLGTWKISENQAYALLLALAQEVGATIVTAGQQQDLGLLVRETITAADDRKNAAIGTTVTLPDLNAFTDQMRDLRDTFRRAGIITG